jgi:DNA-binding NarL/FixJ family response regulator
MNQQPCRIALADDYIPLRQEVRRLLGEVPDLEVTGEAGGGLELLTFLKSCHLLPHLVILNLSMPGVSGIETLQKIKKNYPGVRVLILTRHQEDLYLRQAISSGAEGYVVIQDVAEELLPAIDAIRQGKAYISSFFLTASHPSLSKGKG